VIHGLRVSPDRREVQRLAQGHIRFFGIWTALHDFRRASFCYSYDPSIWYTSGHVIYLPRQCVGDIFVSYTYERFVPREYVMRSMGISRQRLTLSPDPESATSC
jgi:hypothetical protein